MPFDLYETDSRCKNLLIKRTAEKKVGAIWPGLVTFEVMIITGKKFFKRFVISWEFRFEIGLINAELYYSLFTGLKTRPTRYLKLKFNSIPSYKSFYAVVSKPQ